MTIEGCKKGKDCQNLHDIQEQSTHKKKIKSVINENVKIDSKKKLCILDLNGILLEKVNKNFNPNNLRIHDTTINKQKIWFRPHMNEFLEFIFDKFNVGIWSSSMYHNTIPMVEEIFKDYEDKILFIFHRENFIKMMNPNTKEFDKLKDLSLIWKIFENFDDRNSFIIDKFGSNICNSNNGIFIPEYSFENENIKYEEDDTLLILKKYLKLLNDSDDDCSTFLKLIPTDFKGIN